MSVPYIGIPQAVYDAFEDGRLSADQFDIYAYCYWKADRPEFRVSSYSAANVCRFRWEDATEAHVKRFERAAIDLLERELMHRDYRRIDPKRSKKKNRTYSVWVPSPERFSNVGTLEENRVSLWQANVGLLVGDDVGLPTDATSDTNGTYGEKQPDNVGLFVGLQADQMSIKDQKTEKTERERPLNPPAGGLAPSAPEGERCAGRTTRKALSPEQVETWHDLSERFSLLFRKYFAFHPETNFCDALIRQCSPCEVWAAAQRALTEGSKGRIHPNQWKAFFMREAVARIHQLRKVGVVLPKPDEGYDSFSERPLREVSALDKEWRTLFPSVSQEQEQKK